MKTILTTIFLAAFMGVNAQTTITIKDSDLQGNQTYNWTKGNVYLLDGFVFLESGGILNIEAGTVIKGKETPTTGDNASALIIARGAQINASGTAAEPVIFTTELDDVADPNDLVHTDRGLWGGLIVLGGAVIGFQSDTANIEGIPTTETRAVFGGSNDSDNSGTLKYVSIRHGGAELAPGDEINGLTLGGVGSGTTIENVEIFANQDDGIEFFGGTVSVKYLVSVFCGDDAADYDFGWRGSGQFWFVIQGADDADNGGEHDGAKPDDALPFSQPVIYNATYIGSGIGAAAKNSTALHFRDAAGGTYANSIFTQFAKHALEVEDLYDSLGIDSRQRMENGELQLLNNIWYSFGSGTELNTGSNGIIRATSENGPQDPNAQFLINHFNNNVNTQADPQIFSISRMPDNKLNPRISAASPAWSSLASYPSSAFFDAVGYKGAFDSNNNWAEGWTALSEYGYFGDATDIWEKAAQASQINIHPNPVSNEAIISFSLVKTSFTELQIFDIAGRKVKTVKLQELNAGVHNAAFSAAELPNGFYFYHLKINDEIHSGKFSIVK